MSDDFQTRLDAIAAMGELASFEPDVDLGATAVFTSSGAPPPPQGSEADVAPHAAPEQSGASLGIARPRKGRLSAKPTAAGWALRAFRIAPILLVSGLVLAAFPRVDALWFQTLTAGEIAGTGTFGCQPYVIALKSTTTVDNGSDTKYTYTFSGGGISGPECAKDMSYIALPVCFNASLSGDVLSETHPSPGWTYNPQGKNSPYGSRVKWDADNGVGHGPFNALEFSITLAGTNIPTESVTAQYHAGGGNDPQPAGTVLVPHPASCDASKLKTAAPVAPLTNDAVTTDSAPPAEDGARAASSQPTATPSPTSTPTATPTPKTVNKPGEYKGILKFPSTPTPAAGDK